MSPQTESLCQAGPLSNPSKPNCFTEYVHRYEVDRMVNETTRLANSVSYIAPEVSWYSRKTCQPIRNQPVIFCGNCIDRAICQLLPCIVDKWAGRVIAIQREQPGWWSTPEQKTGCPACSTSQSSPPEQQETTAFRWAFVDFSFHSHRRVNKLKFKTL